MDPVLRVLHLEDDPLDSELIRELLSGEGLNVELDRVDALAEMRAALQQHSYAIILSDYTMPGLDPLEALQLARQLRPEVPFIFVSGTLGEDVAIETLKRGATDYVLKQRMGRLVPSVRRALQEAQEQARRKLAEQALRDSESRFRKLAEALPQLVWTARADGTVDYGNQRWAEYTGQPASASAEGNWSAVIHLEDRERAVKVWREAVAKGELYEFEYRLRRHDGVYRWHIARGVPVRGEEGAVRQWFGTCTDIDDQKQAEEELREAARKKDMFLAMLGHELRNPLGPLRNGVHLLEKSKVLDTALQRARDVIRRQVLHMTRLVDELLDVSRISRGKILLRKERVELTELVRATAEDHRASLESSSLTLWLCLPERPIWIDADRTRIAQIVGNLLINAGKFTDPGGHVSVSLRYDAPLQAAVLAVKDSGIGIEAADLLTIFEPFAQVRHSLQRSCGLGLGLSLVKGLAELHGGKAEACSHGEGQGAEFTVALPTIPAPETKATPAAQTESTRAGAARVLVIEDNLDAAETLRMILELVGHEVFVAHSGPEGVEVAERVKPQIILCDIGLPGFDGYEVVRRLRRTPALQATSIVAMTGFGQEEDRRRAQEAGFDRHLTKPVDPEYLERLLTSETLGT